MKQKSVYKGQTKVTYLRSNIVIYPSEMFENVKLSLD